MGLFFIQILDYDTAMTDVESKRWVITLIGPPGAGKGTQADLLAEDFGLQHIETSKVIEEKFKNAKPDDQEIIEAKVQYDAGKLVNPQLFAKWLTEKIRELAIASHGLVFSGSFRTLPESYVLMPVCEELYGKNNIFFVNIEVSQDESVVRNTGRRICKANRHPIPRFAQVDRCPKDGSELIVRSLDKPETIKVRYQTYVQDTAPVLEYIRKQGYNPVKINGEQEIAAVHDDITHALHGLHASMHLDILKQGE